MKTYLFDTNTILRFLVNDVPLQSQLVQDVIEKAKSGTISIYIPVMVIWELVFAFEKFYKISRAEISQKLTKLIRLSYLSIENRGVVLAILERFSTSVLDFADLYFLSLSESETFILFTFDKKLQKEAHKFGVMVSYE